MLSQLVSKPRMTAASSRADARGACKPAGTACRITALTRCHATGSRQATSSRTSIDAKGLSYVGDSIWTLCVRRHFFAPPKHWKTYQDMVLPYVTAEGQAAMYDTLISGAAGATTAELELLQAVRAQVVNRRLRKRFNTQHAAEAYRKATAFEALIGHLHLHDPQRLLQLTEALMDPSMPQHVAQLQHPSAASSSSLTDDTQYSRQ